jgi:hypothetical protein
MLRKLMTLGSWFILVAVVLGSAQPVAAQSGQNTPIVLDDATPSVDIVITPTGGAAGAVYLELDGVHVRLLDGSQAEVLSLIDRRVSALAIQLAAGATPHTLRLERLPGVAVARVLAIAQATLPDVSVAPSNTPLIALNGPVATKAVVAPASTLPVTASNGADLLSAHFPAQDATVQLVDASGGVLLTARAGQQINGLAVRLVPGQYAFNVVNRDLSARSEVALSLSPAPAPALQQVAANPTPAAAPDGGTTLTGNVASDSVACTATVKIASVNLRSGPGTAYSVLGFALQNDVLPVGGVNREGGWLLVGAKTGSAWLADWTVMLSGTCNKLTAFDIPIRNGSARPPAIQPVAAQQPGVAQPADPAPVLAAAPGRRGDDDHGDEGRGGDD